MPCDQRTQPDVDRQFESVHVCPEHSGVALVDSSFTKQRKDDDAEKVLKKVHRHGSD